MAAQAEADAKAALGWVSVQPIEDPVIALSELASEVQATVRAVGSRVQALKSISYTSVIGTEQMRAEVVLLGQYQDRLARILSILGKFDLDERRVKLNEAQALVLFGVLDTFITRLQLPPDRQVEAKAIMADVLHEIDQEAS